MITRRRFIGGTALGLLAASSRLPSAEAAKDQWVVAQGEEGESLDPPSSLLFTSEIYQQHIFEPLVGIEGAAFKTVGLLAERWEIVTPTTWRFHLRKGVKFQNGEPFDAQDVAYSFEQYMNPKSPRFTYASTIEKVDIVDPYTVNVVTRQPFAGLLTNLTRLVMLPRRARERVGAPGFAQHAVGTGAYHVVEWQRDQRLVLQANRTWWRGTASPRRLVFRPIADAGTRAAELRTGGVDIIYAPPVPQLGMLDRGPMQVISVKGGRVIIYPFNLKQVPFDSPTVRQAVNFAVDKDTIVKTVLQGRGVVLAGPFTRGWLGFDPSLRPYPYDPAHAKQLLVEAGYPNGVDTVWNISSGAFLKDTEIAEAVAGQLRQVGMRVTLVPTDRVKLQQDAQAGSFQGITSVAWGTQFEPDPMVSWVFMRPHFGTPTIQKLALQGRQELDVEKRRAIYQELDRTAHHEALWMFDHAQDELWARRREVAWKPYNITGSAALTYYFQVPAS